MEAYSAHVLVGGTGTAMHIHTPTGRSGHRVVGGCDALGWEPVYFGFLPRGSSPGHGLSPTKWENALFWREH